jgi:hypothetical protein
MTLLSIIVAFLVRSGLGRILVGQGPLHILIPGVWSLKDLGVRNHLSLWGDTSLSSCLRHLLMTLGYGWKIGLLGEEPMRGLELLLY